MATRSSKSKTSTSKSASSGARKSASRSGLTAAAKAAVKTAPAAAAAAPDTPAPVVTDQQPVVSGPVLRKRELLEQVVKLSGVKKKSAKPVVEAMLKVLGAALQDGRELNLQPFGKVKINRERKRSEGKVLIARIRQAKDLPSDVVPDPQPQDLADAAPNAEVETPTTDTKTAAE